MKKTIRTLVMGISKAIERDLINLNTNDGMKVFKMLFEAYNDYQESERDGVDYIFNIENGEDVTCCINGGMTIEEVSKLWQNSQRTKCKYFLYDYNYNGSKAFANLEEVVCNLITWIDDVVTDVVAYPYSYDSYKELYRWYITDVVIDYKHDVDNGVEALAELKRKMKQCE